MPDTYESIYLTPDQVNKMILILEQVMNTDDFDVHCKTYVQVLSRLYDIEDRIHIDTETSELYFRSILDDRDKDNYRRPRNAPEDDEQ
jgi:hypothetical protein